MGINYIWIKNQRYYKYELFDTFQEARKQALRQRKRNKCRYFILPYEKGFIFPEKKYILYLNKCIRIW